MVSNTDILLNVKGFFLLQVKLSRWGGEGANGRASSETAPEGILVFCWHSRGGSLCYLHNSLGDLG